MRVTNEIMALATFAIMASSGAMAQTLRVGLQDDPDSLDPATGGTYAGRIVFDALCDKLVDIDANLQIVPQLATEWSWNEDQTALTMKLREGVTFHDGETFDAEAVKANIERMQTMGESRRKSELSPIASVEATDATTVVFTLEQSFAPLLSILTDRAGMMVSPAAATSADAFAENPACSGPFEFASRQSRDNIKLTRFEDYWNADEISYDEVEYDIVPDATVRLARLQAGDLEVAERMAPTDLAAIRDDAGLALHTAPGLAVSHLFVNLGENGGDLAASPDLRHALELSIDRSVINQVAFSGEFTADNQMIPPSSDYHSDAVPMPERDVERAQELIEQSGIPSPTIEITFENSTTDARVAQIIQQMASEAGFAVELLPLETSSAIERYLNGNFELYIGNWSGRADPDPTLTTFFGSEGSQNLNGYRSEEMDAALEEGRTSLEAEARKAAYDEVAQIYLEDLPTIPLYHPTWFYGSQAGIEGIEIYPDGILRLTGVKPTAN
ncbi:peptide/nickel transport system substrate-binding protein [Palleronia aestuarii]|uniref:Peptide/nickel transport system substrate-binding protein n=1 Tax=Palleronia aestuarii TaxID=568105 RepID=A0A2W7NNZ8_9RHOB|nr:ABC transporter substrate-binding protein [Palleronia aestuarii]PZX13002.1 peptide/nickel transport system substrate-binding protein [Palleronia aestuarii]